jgi:hypothetical protein
MFTPKDKIAKLQRLMKPIDEWNSDKDLPPILRIGKPALSVNSEEFKEWRDKVTATITLIFGEYSHYSDDFNEIAYTDFFDQMSRLAGKEETRYGEGWKWPEACFKQWLMRLRKPKKAPWRQRTRLGSGLMRSAKLCSSIMVEVYFGRDYNCTFKMN